MLGHAQQVDAVVTVAELTVEIGKHIQRAFERDRVMQAAAEEQRVVLLRKRLRPCHHVGLKRERAANRRRQVAERFQAFRLFVSRQKSAQLGERQRKQKVYGELRSERLRGR